MGEIIYAGFFAFALCLFNLWSITYFYAKITHMFLSLVLSYSALFRTPAQKKATAGSCCWFVFTNIDTHANLKYCKSKLMSSQILIQYKTNIDTHANIKSYKISFQRTEPKPFNDILLRCNTASATSPFSSFLSQWNL